MAPVAKRKVLLSGGIGAGKSTVARLLAGLGAHVISTDLLGHALFEPDSPVYSAVANRWPGVVASDGAIDRRLLGGIVFADPVELEALEALTHPAIRRAALERADASAAEVVVVEIPLRKDFLGRGWRRVVVHADAERRFARLQARGLEAEDVTARMAAQPSDEEWLEWADYVVDNSGDEESLGDQVALLWRWIRDGGKNPRGQSRLAPRVE